ncbi:MAG TPA: MFS transporter [Acidimicrobiia bacterium]|nr:MFS transporter [Acidimicrobiia bacterium]
MSSPAVTTPPEVDYSRKWLVLMSVAASTLLATIDGSIVNVAFPTLVAELNTSFNVIQWVALAYLLAIATLTMSMGRLGDVVGKKRLYVLGIVVFTVGSALCGLAPDVSWLIGFRVLQAIGAVLVLALGAAILVEAFPPSERGKALGWIGTTVSLGVISGPVIGGVLIGSFGWRAIFFVNIPVGIVGALLSLRYVPNTAPPRGQKFDIAGAVLMSLALFSLSLALTLGQEAGFNSPPILAGFAMFALATVAFIVVELRTETPMLQLRLFRRPMLTVSVVTGFLTFSCLAATFFLMPFYLEGVLGFSVSQIGFLLGASPLMMGLVSPISGTLSDRLGVRRLTLVGLVVIAATYIGFTTLSVDTTVVHYLMLAVPLGIGLGIFNSPNNSAIMGSVPPEYMGIGGGLLTITRLLGQISGVAVLGSIWATSVAAHNGGSLPPEGAPGADPVAQVAGLHTTFTVAAGIMLVSLVVGAWGMQRERRDRRQPTTLAVEA